MDEKPKSEKTAVAVQQSTKRRLQSHMHYGETIDGMINKLLDAYDKVHHTDVLIADTRNEEERFGE